MPKLCFRVAPFLLVLLAACTPPNEAPTISQPGAVSVFQNTLAAPEEQTVSFSIKDKEDKSADLKISAGSSSSAVTLGTPTCNSAGECSLKLTLAKTAAVQASVTLSVKDSKGATASSSFSVSVEPEEKTVASDGELKALLEGAAAGTVLKISNTEPVLLDKQIILDKELTLVGTGLEKTFLDAGGLDRHFWIKPGGKVILRDLTLTNGNAQDEASTVYDEPLGGAIFNEGLLTLEKVRILSSRAVRGGAVYTFGPTGTTVIRDSIIGQSNASNVATRSGGGLFNDAGRLELYNSNISFNNGVERGGGIYNYLETATLIIEDSLFSSNISWDGTAIKNELGKVTIRGSTIENNTASQVEGGAIFNLDGQMEIYNSTLRNNKTLQGSGGAIYSTGGNAYILLDATTLTDNQALRAKDRGGVGGAIYNDTNPTGAGVLELRNGTKILNNHAVADGGAIFNVGQLKISADCQITGNVAGATFNGGGLYNVGTVVVEDKTVLSQVFQDNEPDNIFEPPPGLRYITSIAKFVLVNKAD
jgi:hypothetical protein